MILEHDTEHDTELDTDFVALAAVGATVRDAGRDMATVPTTDRMYHRG